MSWSFRNRLSWANAVFLQHKVAEMLETIWSVAKLTVETALPEDGADKRRNTSEY
jgi:hypothetical protein